MFLTILCPAKNLHSLTKSSFSEHPYETPSNSETSLEGRVLCWDAQNWCVLLSLSKL